MIKGKKKDAKKKDAKKDGKKAAGEKSEQPLDATAENSLTTLPDLQNESVNGETQAIPKPPDQEPTVEEPPVQAIPPMHEEPVLAQVIIESYEGGKVGDFYEGEGFMCFEGGNTYKGLFSEGRMHGEGTFTWADGVTYEGTFTKNVPMHNGRYTWKDGSVYEGSIQDGIRHGYGVFRSSTHPISYAGYWCNGKRHGQGRIYYNQEQTSWYEGEWVNNVREGWGLRRYSSGNTYEGQWKKNLRHGHGKMIWLTDNQKYIGKWEYGIQHGPGTHTWFLERMEMTQYSVRNEYMGDFVKGERHGYGIFVYAGGTTYAGQWVHNKKHGKGTLLFKNGHIFQGEFVNDHPVECSLRQEAVVKAKKLRAPGTGRRSGTKKTPIINDLGKSSILGSHTVLDIPLLLKLVSDKDEEMKQVELAVLRHISELRKVYYFYSTLGRRPSPDGICTMTKLQFWKFLKNCQFHLSSIPLAEMDRLLRDCISDSQPLMRIHCPAAMLGFRTFLSCLIQLAFHIYHEEYKDEVPHLQKCFLKMMSRNVLPSAFRIQGVLYSGEEFTSFAISYIDKCLEIYKDFCRPRPSPPFEPIVKLRQFLWMLDDFKLLNEQLTAPRVVGIFVKVGAYLPGIHGVNLEQEMVFLEFFEALLECALVYVTDDMILKKEAQDNEERSSFELSKQTSAVSLTEPSPPQPPGPSEDTKPARQPSLLETLLSFPITPGESKDDVSLPNEDVKEEQDFSPEKELTDEAKDDEDEQKELLHLWMCKVETFFTTKFFPGFDHEIVLRDKIKETKKQDAELAELRKIHAEELERLIAAKEEEAEKRRKAAAEAKALEESVKHKRGALSKKSTPLERVLSRRAL